MADGFLVAKLSGMHVVSSMCISRTVASQTIDDAQLGVNLRPTRSRGRASGDVCDRSHGSISVGNGNTYGGNTGNGIGNDDPIIILHGG